jgi:hypothetical protein
MVTRTICSLINGVLYVYICARFAFLLNPSHQKNNRTGLKGSLSHNRVALFRFQKVFAYLFTVCGNERCYIDFWKTSWTIQT